VEFQADIPFARLLGLELVRFEPALAVLALEMRPELTNSWAVAHGGVTMTLLDVAMAHAARSPRVDGSAWESGVVTVEMKTSFLLPAEGRLHRLRLADQGDEGAGDALRLTGTAGGMERNPPAVGRLPG
jgi:uncharacterized protein (TIGR00369 family)